MRVTTQQKRELASLARAVKLDPGEFEVTSHEDEFRIKYRHDFFGFIIKKRSDNSYRASIHPVDNRNGYVALGNWHEVLAHFKTWVQGVASDTLMTDGWEKEVTLSDVFKQETAGNNPFSDAEKIAVRQSLNYLKEKVQHLDMEAATQATILEKLDELSEKLDDLGKFDWQSLFWGSILSLVTTLALPQEVAGSLWYWVKAAFTKSLGEG